jgi:transcription elongation factor GreA
MSEIINLSKERYDELRAKLDELKGKGRSEVAKAIQEAREKGDLSENAEYDAAKDRQALLEHDIARTETILANARILDTSNLDTDRVYLLSVVKVRNLNANKEMKYTLVAEQEADLKSGKLSIKSPVGKALLGHKQGDVVEVIAPAGKMSFEILEITLS